MSNENKIAIELLQGLARCRERSIDLSSFLRSRPEVVEVTTTFDCRKYLKNPWPILEVYVDAELQGGTALAWLLDATWEDEQWHVDYRIASFGEQGQDIVYQFPEKTARAPKELIDILVEAYGDLIEHCRTIDLSHYLPDSRPMPSAIKA